MNRLIRNLMSILALIFACLSPGVQAQNIETATEAVKNMGLGWNLGNTLDANSQKVSDVTNDAYWGGQGLDSEYCWGQKPTTKPLFEMLKNAGFGAIRVPVTWYNHMDKDGKVNEAWMARVHEVVDYVIESGLYCIVNVHHDTGADSDNSKSWIKADMATYNNQKERYEYLWMQIAEEFKDYDGHLLFEAYNEMLDIKSSWCFASFNTTNRYDATIAKSAYDAINSYAQSFVNTVRATGGNNAQRNLIVNTYGACSGEGTWNTHLTEPLQKMALPEDNVQNHIIFEIHTYPTIANNTLASIKSNIDQCIKNLKTYLVSKGAPVIIGEWGTNNVDAGEGKTDYDVRRELMLDFVEYFVKQMKANGMAPFYWMGLTDGTYRTFPAFNQPDLAERMAKAYHGEDFKGEFPIYVQPAKVTCFEGTKALGWGDGINIEAAVFKNAGEQCQLELTYTQTVSSGDDIQLYYGNWSEKSKFIVNGKTYNSDFNPSSVYKTKANSKHVTVFTFPKANYTQIAQLGLNIHGSGVTLTKAVVIDPVAVAGIAAPSVSTSSTSSVIYNLSGQRVSNDYKGIVIKNGKKVLIK